MQMVKRHTDLKEATKKITDVFSGVDGGIAFSKFYHATLPMIERELAEGDHAAKQLRDIIIHFANLLEATT
jgi:hypothetical protein